MSEPIEVTADFEGLSDVERAKAVTPMQLSAADLLDYKLHEKELQFERLKLTMYQRELERAQIDLAEADNRTTLLRSRLEKAYEIDLSTHMVTTDGYLVPRQPGPNSAMLGRR